MQRFSGKEYLKIDIANNFGLDKKTWTERLEWFDQHEDCLMEMLPQAEEPALFYAGVKAYFDVLDGKPIGYPISLDATSSGLQLLGVLTGDRFASEICNVVNQPGDVRADAYTIVYDEMCRRLGESAKIKRDDCKRSIMTALYGSQAVPKEVFGEGRMLITFLETMKAMAPAAWELNETFLAIWDGDALSNDWVLPDNFHVHVKVMTIATETVNFLHEPFDVVRKINAPTKDGRSLGANTIHSIDGMIVREMTRRCDYDPKVVTRVIKLLEGEKTGSLTSNQEDNCMVLKLWEHYVDSGYLSVRILEHLNEHNILFVDPGPIWVLLGSLPKKPFKLQAIHDCFRCLPHYGNDLRWQYNNQLHLIAKSNLLGFILSQLLHREVLVGKLDETMIEEILDADYALS
jgi:hypothetical protein